MAGRPLYTATPLTNQYETWKTDGTQSMLHTHKLQILIQERVTKLNHRLICWSPEADLSELLIQPDHLSAEGVRI